MAKWHINPAWFRAVPKKYFRTSRPAPRTKSTARSTARGRAGGRGRGRGREREGEGEGERERERGRGCVCHCCATISFIAVYTALIPFWERYAYIRNILPLFLHSKRKHSILSVLHN